jgi:hypothetical protein
MRKLTHSKHTYQLPLPHIDPTVFKIRLFKVTFTQEKIRYTLAAQDRVTRNDTGHVVRNKQIRQVPRMYTVPRRKR